MMRGRWMVAGAVIGVAVATRAGAARLAVTASRPEVLYSSAGNLSCSDLSKVTDDSLLPFHIVRLHAAAPAGVPVDQVRYEWSFPKPALGMLLADADLGPGEQDPAIRSLCAELGNECVLTAEQLALYNKPSILWVAPGCDVLPTNTSRQFRGGRVRIGAKASIGKRRLGKGAATIGFGRLGSLKLFVKDPGEKHFRDGIGKPNGEMIFINPDFAVRLDTTGIATPVQEITIDSAGGGSVDRRAPFQACSLDPSFTACTDPGDIDYSVGGKPLASATAILTDQSALCDKLTVNIRTTTIIPKLEVSISPKRGPYVPGDATRGSVNLRVTLHDVSPPGSGGNILLKGNILTCDSEVRVGRSMISKTTQIDLQHCSVTVHQPCGSDAECAPPACKDCVPSEICLSSSHCSSLFVSPIGCTSDRDCRPPRCRECNPFDTCIQVLPLQQIFLGVGDSVDLVKSTIPVINTLPATAQVTDTWTAHTFNAGDDSDVVKYKIAPRPDVKP